MKEEQRATLASLAGDDAAAITAVLRACHNAELQAIATGEGYIHPSPTTDPSRLLSVSDFVSSLASRHLAARALELRRTGEHLTRAALAGLGYAYDGTGGWWITAYAVEPDNHLGFVNIAKGIAVRTDVMLTTEIVEALTVPDQTEGSKCSGAVAWTAPDAGEGHRASTPAGWVQLAVDLRGGGEKLGAKISAHIVAWCLTTCYGQSGEPGWLSLDPRPNEKRMDAREWPLPTIIRTEIDRIGREAMEAAARALARGRNENVIAALDAGRIGRAIEAAETWRWSWSPAYSADNATRSLATQAARSALTATGWTTLAHACGDAGSLNAVVGARRLDLLGNLIEADVHDRLTPVAEVLFAQVPGSAVENGQPPERWHELVGMLRPVAEQLAATIAVAPIEGMAQKTMVAMHATIASAAPLTVSIQIDHGHR